MNVEWLRCTHPSAAAQAHILLVSESDVCRSVLAAAALRRLLAEAGLAEAVVVDTCVSRAHVTGLSRLSPRLRLRY